MACVITVTGASGCGKSTIINILQDIGKKEKYKFDFKPVVIKKFTTRKFRKSELFALKEGKLDELDVKAVFGDDNIVRDENGNPLDEDKQDEYRKQCIKKLNCDLIYEQYGNQYGIKFNELYECLKRDETPIVILNDVRTVEDVKVYFGKKSVSLFVFRNTPNFSFYEQMELKRQNGTEECDNRFEKAISIYRIYIENIHLFDKLVLNVKEGKESLEIILEQLVDEICQKGVMFSDERGENK